MTLADKPYAELLAACSKCIDAEMVQGLLKAAKVLPPERAQMMLAVVALAPLISEATGVCDQDGNRRLTSRDRERCVALDATLRAFIEEAGLPDPSVWWLV